MPVKTLWLAVATALVLPLLFGSALAQERWAAIVPNEENSSTVVRATTKEEAEQLAVDACKQVSDTCALRAATTDGMNNYFAIMCCTQPRKGCAAGVASTKKKALEEVKTIFSDEGFTSCKLKNYIKAGTGRKS